MAAATLASFPSWSRNLLSSASHTTRGFLFWRCGEHPAVLFARAGSFWMGWIWMHGLRASRSISSTMVQPTSKTKTKITQLTSQPFSLACCLTPSPRNNFDFPLTTSSAFNTYHHHHLPQRPISSTLFVGETNFWALLRRKSILLASCVHHLFLSI